MTHGHLGAPTWNIDPPPPSWCNQLPSRRLAASPPHRHASARRSESAFRGLCLAAGARCGAPVPHGGAPQQRRRRKALLEELVGLPPKAFAFWEALLVSIQSRSHSPHFFGGSPLGFEENSRKPYLLHLEGRFPHFQTPKGSGQRMLSSLTRVQGRVHLGTNPKRA